MSRQGQAGRREEGAERPSGKLVFMNRLRSVFSPRNYDTDFKTPKGTSFGLLKIQQKKAAYRP
jgi:hypothetical protein